MMLLPKKSIFIVYGHNQDSLRAAEEAVNEASREGFRVKPIKISEKELFEINPNAIYEAIQIKAYEADAAIILGTSDDIGGELNDVLNAKSLEEAMGKMKKRVRQNVILEWGIFLEKLGNEGTLVLLDDKEIEELSDLRGRFWHYVKTENDIKAEVRKFIKKIDRLRYNYSLSNATYQLDYSDLVHVGNRPHDTFSSEYSRLDSDEDKALYLAERLVFVPYIGRATWWRDKALEINHQNNHSLIIASNILDQIFKYIEDRQNYDVIEQSTADQIRENLEEQLSLIERGRITLNPAILIPAYNYLGLAQRVAAGGLENEEPKEYIDRLCAARRSFSKCQELAERYDDRRFNLWKGFALFNKARVTYSLIPHLQKVGNEDTMESCKKDMGTAKTLRKRWINMDYNIPEVIRSGLQSEYFHAVLHRITQSFLYGGYLNETGPYSINDTTVENEGKEFIKWWKDTEEPRVRLAIQVKRTWDIISEQSRANGT